MDHALYFAEGKEKTEEYLRIVYTSLFSGLALVNAGGNDPFYPHADNKGAAFHDLHDSDRRKHMTLDRDTFDEIRVNRMTGAVCIRIRNVTGNTHRTTLTVNGGTQTVDVSREEIRIEV